MVAARLFTGIAAGFALLVHAVPAAAQTEAALKQFFEGRRVTLRIAMPATSDGIDLRPDAERPLDTGKYSDRIRTYGTSIYAGDSPVVTLVKLKKDLIEFQLDGGGYGTFGDDTSTSVDIPLVEKTLREKDIEQQLKTETDTGKRRRLQQELDELRNARERENRRITAEKAAAESIKRARIAEMRLRGGSRFNLRYTPTVPSGIRPQDVMAALAEYVDFAPTQGPTATVRGEPGSAPRKGLLRDEAERMFGRPASVTDRREGTLRVTTVVFLYGQQRISAEFVDDVLIRYTVTPR